MIDIAFAYAVSYYGLIPTTLDRVINLEKSVSFVCFNINIEILNNINRILEEEIDYEY